MSDALFLANHPARKGIDSPHEIRGWRDAQPRIAVGMEGAPGHQAGGLPAPHGPGSARGLYDNSPSPASYADTASRGPNSDFDNNGVYSDPVYRRDLNLGNTDFWPGYYSRTHVGASSFSYAAVMDGIRQGRVWVDHGRLISGLDVRARSARSDQLGVTLGGVLHVRQGERVELVIDIELAGGPNWSQFVPALARVDVIQGDVTGAVSDKDTFTAPNTKVVKSFEVGENSGSVRLVYDLGAVDRPVYVRLRGTDGNRCGAGPRGAAIDPNGPQVDVVGNADPWKDLWFYANPIWVLPRR
ncbi:MAG: hypothetical protein JWO67_3707 [Streptosporangiaceae bacterium]|nr:hypothetical protein [Streptosporangiaceae bacterium]